MSRKGASSTASRSASVASASSSIRSGRLYAPDRFAAESGDHLNTEFPKRHNLLESAPAPDVSDVYRLAVGRRPSALGASPPAERR